MRREKSLILIFFGSSGMLFYLNFLSVNSVPVLLNLLIFGVGTILLHWGYSRVEERNSQKLKWTIAFIEMFIAIISLIAKSQTTPVMGLSIGLLLTLILVMSVRKYILKKKEANTQ